MSRASQCPKSREGGRRTFIVVVVSGFYVLSTAKVIQRLDRKFKVSSKREHLKYKPGSIGYTRQAGINTSGFVIEHCRW